MLHTQRKVVDMLTNPIQTPDPGSIEAAIVTALAAGLTYEEVAARLEVSRGRIWSVAVKFGARKHEARINERAAQRKARQTEFLREVIDATAKADVLDYLDGLPDECAQMVVTSPPYNVGKAYGSGDRSDRSRFHYYLGWMLQVLSEMDRIVKPGGVIFLQVGSTRDDDQNLYPLDCLFFEHLRGMGLTFNSRVIWRIPHGLTPKRRLSERHETALIFSKGVPAHFNATPMRTPQKQPSKRAFKGPRKGELSGNPYGAWPSNVWDIGNVGNNHPERTGHPAQFPENIAYNAIACYSMPGELIVDPFNGSGTTQVVCKRTGRAFTGADLSYGELREQRLAAISPDLVSVLPGITDESLAIWQADASPVHVPAASPAPESLALNF